MLSISADADPPVQMCCTLKGSNLYVSECDTNTDIEVIQIFKIQNKNQGFFNDCLFGHVFTA